ncbi:galactose mutarotase [Sphingomonas sp. BGYR3]|uniref:aldose epimerase family protein n=1 Tax=Sphingomonas sp. BGYR3 TaxID=2975483 RepID=UPI0021A6AD84|nr:aldose epimerase family protein [Sphingomonas sp. BGYR3]MDG5488277.1 galactose mutarotase [Sphingomonas sp. BGYR3]
MAMAFGVTAAGCSGGGDAGNGTEAASTPADTGITITDKAMENLPDGRFVTKWELRNKSGAGLTIMDLGATILTLDVPDRDGKLADVNFGFDTAAPYLTDSPYFGAVVGRFANRIAKGRFTLDGKSYQLATNNAPNHLHGGEVGFDKSLWSGRRVDTADGPGVRFTLVSPDGDQGYPGQVTATVTYVWTDDNRLIVDYGAETTKATPFNISQHAYFNLAGVNAKTVLDHTLKLNADRYLPTDPTAIPTGELAPVEGTPFDFRTAKPIGRDIGAKHPQIAIGKGYDHNWVLNGSGMREAAVLADPGSGRVLTISTNEPGIQFYSGNFLDGSVTGKGGNAYGFRSAVALETQHFPDSPNQPGFPDAILRPGKPYASRTIFAFSTEK